jgi:hypothetical protein
MKSTVYCVDQKVVDFFTGYCGLCLPTLSGRIGNGQCKALDSLPQSCGLHLPTTRREGRPMATLSASLTVKHTLVNFPTQFWGLSLPTLVHAREVDTDFHRFRTGCSIAFTGADRQPERRCGSPSRPGVQQTILDRPPRGRAWLRRESSLGGGPPARNDNGMRSAMPTPAARRTKPSSRVPARLAGWPAKYWKPWCLMFFV